MSDYAVNYDLAALRQIIERSDTSDLRIICYDLGHRLSVDYDIIVGEGKNKRDASLLIVQYFQKRALIPILVERLKNEYPSENWNGVVFTKPQPQYVLCATNSCTYVHGNEDFDESFLISYSGKLFGEYGADVANVFRPSSASIKRARAFKVWVFDASEFQSKKVAVCTVHLLNDDAAIRKVEALCRVISTENRDFYIQTNQFRVHVKIPLIETFPLEMFEEGYYKKVDFHFDVYRDTSTKLNAL